MRICYNALAVAIAIASAGATSTSTEFSPVVLTDQGAFSTKRFLRIRTTTNAEEGEERVILGINLGFVDDIASGVMKEIDDVSENAQMMRILNGLKKEGKRPDEAYRPLKLDKVEGNLLESKEFAALEKYVKMTTGNEDPDEVLAAAVSANIGGDGFSKKMAEAMNNPNTKAMAETLEVAQLSRWLKDKFTPVTILKTQKLDKPTDTLFDSPHFTTWSNFLTAYNKKNPKKAMTQLEAFTVYGEKGLLKLLGTLDDGPGAKSLRTSWWPVG